MRNDQTCWMYVVIRPCPCRPQAPSCQGLKLLPDVRWCVRDGLTIFDTCCRGYLSMATPFNAPPKSGFADGSTIRQSHDGPVCGPTMDALEIPAVVEMSNFFLQCRMLHATRSTEVPTGSTHDHDVPRPSCEKGTFVMSSQIERASRYCASMRVSSICLVVSLFGISCSSAPPSTGVTKMHRPQPHNCR